MTCATTMDLPRTLSKRTRALPSLQISTTQYQRNFNLWFCFSFNKRVNFVQLQKVRFCSVSTSCFDFVFNFAKKHLLFSNSNLDRHHLVLSCQCSSSELLVSDSSISSIFSSTSTTSFTRLNHPLLLNLKDIYYYYSSRVSICYGMLCVRVDPSSAVLCNPSITKFHILKLQKNMDPNLIHFSL